MPINSVNARSSGGAARPIEETVTTKFTFAELEIRRSKIAFVIKRAQNDLAELSGKIKAVDETVVAHKSLLKSLASVTNKHGGAATVRLKDGKFKYGQGSSILKNIFNCSRYQRECAAAVKILQAKGNKISVSDSKVIINERMTRELDESNSLNQEAVYTKGLWNYLEEELSVVTREIDRVGISEGKISK